MRGQVKGLNMLTIMGIAAIFLGLLLPALEAWYDRGWPSGTAKGCLCLIVLGIVCLSL